MLQPDLTMMCDPGVAYISCFQSINGIAASAYTHDDDNNEIMDPHRLCQFLLGTPLPQQYTFDEL